MTTRIIVADDHPLFRDALTQLLQRSMPGLEIIQADSFGALLGELGDSHALPSLLLLDLKLGDTQGLDGLLLIKKQHPSLPVLVISAYDDSQIVRKARQYGASGFVPKSLDMEAMAKVISEVLAGEVWFPELGELADGDQESGAVEELTPTQLKVLALLRDGQPSKSMADALGVTEATIKAHLTEIFRKLKVRNRTQAVLAARDLDLPDAFS